MTENWQAEPSPWRSPERGEPEPGPQAGDPTAPEGLTPMRLHVNGDVVSIGPPMVDPPRLTPAAGPTGLSGPAGPADRAGPAGRSSPIDPVAEPIGISVPQIAAPIDEADFAPSSFAPPQYAPLTPATPMPAPAPVDIPPPPPPFIDGSYGSASSYVQSPYTDEPYVAAPYAEKPLDNQPYVEAPIAPDPKLYIEPTTLRPAAHEPPPYSQLTPVPHPSYQQRPIPPAAPPVIGDADSHATMMVAVGTVQSRAPQPPATVEDAERVLGAAVDSIDASPDLYSIGSITDGAVCLIPDNGRWSVFLADAGQRRFAGSFDDPMMAAVHFAGVLLLAAAERGALPKPSAQAPAALGPGEQGYQSGQGGDAVGGYVAQDIGQQFGQNGQVGEPASQNFGQEAGRQFGQYQGADQTFGQSSQFAEPSGFGQDTGQQFGQNGQPTEPAGQHFGQEAGKNFGQETSQNFGQHQGADQNFGQNSQLAEPSGFGQDTGQQFSQNGQPTEPANQHFGQEPGQHFGQNNQAAEPSGFGQDAGQYRGQNISETSGQGFGQNPAQQFGQNGQPAEPASQTFGQPQPQTPAPNVAPTPAEPPPSFLVGPPITPLPGDPPTTLYADHRLTALPPGTEVDRFGDQLGNTVYAARTPYSHRSLPADYIERDYRVYRLREPLRVLAGTAIPWFGQPGGGTAYLLPAPIAELLREGALMEVTGSA